MKKSISLAISDMKNITRDFISIIMLFVPLLIGFILRFLPYIFSKFENLKFNISDYY